MKPQVVVVGSYVQDLSFACERFPQPGESVVGSLVSGPGGKGSNQAVAAHRAGASVFFVGAVGRDAFAAEAKKFYRDEGIPARLVEKPKHATAAAAVIVNRSGQNQIVVALGASTQLRPGEVDPALIRGARVVICENEANDAVTAHAFLLARRAGALAVLNPAPMRPGFNPSLLGAVDVLIPNENEFVALANLVPGTAALLREAPYAGLGPFTEAALNALSGTDLHRLCRALGVPTIIVTLGARGVFVSQSATGEFIPAHRVKAIDTTGAGDAFVGGFAAGLVKFEGDIMRAARFGNATAALAVTKLGAARAMPRKREILQFLRRAG